MANFFTETPLDKPELKEGDLVICWDFDNKSKSIIASLIEIDEDGYFQTNENWYRNAIKFESEEQYRKLLKGEL